MKAKTSLESAISMPGSMIPLCTLPILPEEKQLLELQVCEISIMMGIFGIVVKHIDSYKPSANPYIISLINSQVE